MLQGSLAEGTGHDSSLTHPPQMFISLAQCEHFFLDYQTVVKTWGFSSAHLSQVKLVLSMRCRYPTESKQDLLFCTEWDGCSCSPHPFTAGEEEGLDGSGAMGCPSCVLVGTSTAISDILANQKTFTLSNSF